MDEREYKKALRFAARAQGLLSDFENRLNAFQSQYEEALNKRERQQRIFELRRVRDELNGYSTSIYETLYLGTHLYKNKKKRIKTFKKIHILFDKDVEFLDELTGTLKHNRHRSAHPDAYQLNLQIFIESDFIKKGLQKLYVKLRDLLQVNDYIIQRERFNQEKWLENQFEKSLSTKKLKCLNKLVKSIS
ncbi:hypothetical protein [Lysinibacillus sp. 3P01SB]|uniref:hypothetical protein n=1 Tax=Lysinibacillus sp. 3P01SB TaxID=3132284 RepID=UPI0039A7027E